MTTPLTHEEFAKHLYTKFLIRLSDNETVELEMTELSDEVVSPRQKRFSIIFSGPKEKDLGQGTRRFEHERMGEFELFIVPIAADDNAISYEANFNLLPAAPEHPQP